MDDVRIHSVSQLSDDPTLQRILRETIARHGRVSWGKSIVHVGNKPDFRRLFRYAAQARRHTSISRSMLALFRNVLVASAHLSCV